MSESAKKRCNSPEWISAQRARGTPLPLETVREMYESGMSQVEIGECLGVSQKVVWRFMKNNGIKARTAAKRNQYGENNDSWRGGKIVDEAGYTLIQCKGHPRASKCGAYVMEHILVAEKTIGRYLADNEVVHHINGRKWDNRPENLAVMTKSEHVKLHWMIRRYKPDA